MHAQDPQTCAAIRLPTPAGDALATVEVGLDGTPVAWSNPSYGGTYLYYLYTKLMAEDSGIAEERLPAPKSVHIGAANTNPPHPHQRLTGTRAGRFRRIGKCKATRLFQGNGFHLF